MTSGNITKSAASSDVTSDEKPRLRSLRQEITDVPNLVTLVRIALIPLVLLFIDSYSQHEAALACLIFAAAAFTDFLDGYLARRLGMVTIVGKFLDPLADKIIVHVTLIYLAADGRIPAWLVCLLIVRDFAINGLRAIASQEGLVIAAGRLGKIKTALQLIGIAFVILRFPYPIIFVERTVNFHEAGLLLLYLSVVLSIMSAVEYLRFFVNAADKKAKELEAQGLTREAVKAQAKKKRRKLKALRRAIRGQKRQRRFRARR